MRQTSLTYPLHMAQVQAMLLRRHRPVAELQFSCWQAPSDRQWCCSCEKCFQIAMITLAEGLSPTAVGIDPVSVLCANADYSLEPTGKVPRLHDRRTSRDKIVRALLAVPTERAASFIAGHVEPVTDNRVGEALAVYARLRAEALAKTVLPEPGYVADFLNLIHADLRDPLRSILGQHFPATAEPEFKAMSGRAQALAAWITAPLRQRRFARLRRSAA